MHPAHTTFDTETDAETWLATVRADIARERFVCPVERHRAEEAARLSRQTVREYAETWLAARRKPNGDELTPRTRKLYRAQLDELLETFGDVPLDQVTDSSLRKWWTHDLPARHPNRKTGNAHLYSLLRTILGSAVDDRLIPANPANVRGAGSTRRAREVRPATIPELEAIASAAPAQYRLAVLLAGWCALRFGELFELRRRDVAENATRLAIRRAVTHRDGTTWVGAPKANSGRDVAVPPHLRDALLNHMTTYAQPGPDGLLFTGPSPAAGRCSCGYAACTGGHMLNSTCYRWYSPARDAGGRPDLRFHDLRHTGLTLAAHAGASLADLMARAGHRSISAAQVYMHAADGRDDEIAARMSELLEGSSPAKQAGDPP